MDRGVPCPTCVVSVVARPLSSIVRMTDLRCRCLPSDTEPKADLPSRLTGGSVRGIKSRLVLLLNDSSALLVGSPLLDRGTVVRLLR